jgi:porin
MLMLTVKSLRTSSILFLVLSLMIVPALMAQDGANSSAAAGVNTTVASDTAAPAVDTPAAPIAHSAVQTPPPPPPAPRSGPLSSVGAKLNEKGITPVVNALQFVLTNPSLGQKTGSHGALTLVTVGGDFDLQKLVGFQGSTIHFQQLIVPQTNNLAYGNIDAGDELGGQPPPYIPKEFHLTEFTWEQKAFHNKLNFEFGKSNAGNYFALPVCNQGFTCQSVLVQDSGGSGMSPAPYGNWLGRVAFNFTPKATLQFGEWRETAAFPFTNGWELNKKATDSNVYAVNFLYRTNPFNDKYPKTYEVMFYHNTAVQAPPGTAFSPYGPPIPTFTTKAHDGTSGMYVGARQMVYRPDGGKGGPFPTRALSVFANDITSFDQANTTGVATQANAGIILDAPFKSRPHDSLSLKMQFLHVTNDEQNFMKAANLAAGGSGYTVGPTEFGIGPDANIILPGPIVLCPYAVRSFNANTFMNPWFAGKPQNGWAAGIVMVFLLDKASGLAPAH